MRLEPYQPLTTQETEVVDRLARGDRPRTIARALGIKVTSVYRYMASAAQKIPGDYPRITKLILWWKGDHTL